MVGAISLCSSSVTDLPPQLLGDVVEQRRGHLLLERGVAHHQSDDLRHIPSAHQSPHSTAYGQESIPFIPLELQSSENIT